MSYEKLGFTKGQVLKADHLNHIEEGIAKAASSWNDLTDKPFDSVAVEPITFNGNLDGRPTASLPPFTLVQVDSMPLSKEGLIGGELTTLYDGAEIGDLITESVLFEEESCLIIAIENTPHVISVYEDGFDFDGAVLYRGVYFLYMDEANYVSKLILPEQIKKIDAKYLPNVGVTKFYVYSGDMYKSIDLSEENRVYSIDLERAIDSGLIVLYMCYAGGTDGEIYYPLHIYRGNSGYWINMDNSRVCHTADYEAAVS